MILDLEEKFGLLTNRIRVFINSDKLTESSFRERLKYILPQRLRGLKKHIGSEWTECDDFSEAFDTLDYIWTFVDYDLLQFIIKKWGADELMNEMDAYMKEVDYFCEHTTVYDLIVHWRPRISEDNIPEDLKKGVMRFAWDPKSTTVNELKLVRKYVRQACPQEIAVIAYCIFYKVQLSSVTVTWLFWTKDLPRIVESIKIFCIDVPDFSEKFKILSFVIDDMCLYSADVSNIVHILYIMNEARM